MKKGLMLVILTAFISGFSIFINKFGVSMSDAYLFTFMKNSIVAIVMFGIIYFAGNLRNFSEIKAKEWGKLLVIGVVGGSIPFLMFFRGLQLTTAAKASFIHKTMFIYVAFLAYFFLKEKISWKIAGASVLLLLGNFLLLKLSWQPFNIGDALVLGAALLWAIENVVSKNILKEVEPKIVGFSRMFFGSIFILVFLAATDNLTGIMALTSQQIIWSLITAGLLLAYVLTWYSGLKDVPVTLATVILMLGSPITTLLNYASGTPIEALQIFGILLLGLGTYVFASGHRYSSSA
ncbi:MAG: DMT family transporter [archaeon]